MKKELKKIIEKSKQEKLVKMQSNEIVKK